MSHTIQTLIVDDEAQSRALISKLLFTHFPDIGIDEAGDISSALNKINLRFPDLLFLDVQMRGETGFDLLDQLANRQFEIIFTTAHSEFAVRAFRYSAMDYLMKPVDTNEFIDTVHKALERILQKHPSSTGRIGFLQKLIKEQAQLPEKITIPTTEGFLLVSIKDILYCRAISNYTAFYLSGNEKVISSQTLGHYEEILSSRHFFRAHRSYLVNLEHIRKYKRGDGGTIVMTNGEEIEVSRNNKEAFLQLFKG